MALAAHFSDLEQFQLRPLRPLAPPSPPAALLALLLASLPRGAPAARLAALLLRRSLANCQSAELVRSRGQSWEWCGWAARLWSLWPPCSRSPPPRPRASLLAPASHSLPLQVPITFVPPPCLGPWAARLGLDPESCALFALTGIDRERDEMKTLYIPHFRGMQATQQALSGRTAVDAPTPA